MSTQPEGRRISPVFIVAGIAGGLAVILLLFNVLTSGGDDAVTTPTTPPISIGRQPTPQPTPEPLEVFEIFEGKDPFRPLVFEGAAGTSPVPGASPAPGATASPAPGATPAPAASQPGVQIELLEVAADNSTANVRVGSQVHQGAKAGQTLSSGVVLTSIQNGCATFRKDPNTFTICKGDMVLK